MMSRPACRLAAWAVRRDGRVAWPHSSWLRIAPSLTHAGAVLVRGISQVAAQEQLEKVKELHRCVKANDQEGLIKLLPDVNVDAVNKRGWTALMVAARLGHASMVETLLHKGSQAGKICPTSQTAKEIAMFWNQEECYKLLQDSAQSESGYPVPWQQGDRNFFTHNPLDRVATLRSEPEVMEKLLERKNTRILLFHQACPIVLPVEKNGRKFFRLFHTDYSTVKSMLRISSDQMIFLGVKHIRSDSGTYKYGKEPLPIAQTEGYSTDMGEQIVKNLGKGAGPQHSDIEAWFAVELPDLTWTIDPSAEVMTLNQDILTLTPEEAALFAQSRTLLDWHQRNKLCPTCGSLTHMKQAGYRRQCSNMDCITHTAIFNSNYPRLDPSVIMLVVSHDQNRCLLGRQRRFASNMFSCLAGFVEPGESIEDAVRREVREEVGVVVHDVSYVSSQPWPMPSSLMLGMLAYTPQTQDIKLDTSELEAASWFSRDDAVRMLTRTHTDGLFLPPTQALGHQLVRQWVKDTAFMNK